MSTDPLQKIRNSTSRALTKISVKTSSSLEKSKVKMQIESLTSDVKKMMSDVGQEVYSLWLQGESLNQKVIEELQIIKEKKDKIEQLVAEIEIIDSREQEILGKKEEPVVQLEEKASDTIICPNCGYEGESSAKFCRKCGKKLN